MAWEARVFDIPGQLAGEDFSSAGGLQGYQGTGQFLFVKVQKPNPNMIVHCNNHKDRPIGVSQGNPVAGDALQVRQLGVSKVVAGAQVFAGQSVGTDNNGRCVNKNETSTGADYGDFVIGTALEGALAAGNLATVLLQSPYRI